MPDIDPAALSRPAVSLSTPTLANKTLSITAPGSGKPVKISQIIPARIDLEPLYTALKATIGADQWLIYKESTAEFLTGEHASIGHPLHHVSLRCTDNGV
jgi:transcriptional coactivator HFI1/ADA1